MPKELKHKLVDKEEIHPWCINNLYLLSGYRKGFDTFKLSLRSIFMVHNEFMNIWSHLIGAICFIVLMLAIVQYYEHRSANHSVLRSNFNVVDVLNDISTHYDENITIMQDLVKNPQNYLENHAGHPTGILQGVYSRLENVIGNYKSTLVHMIHKIERDEIAFMKEFSSNYESIKINIEKVMHVIAKKYHDLVQVSHFEPYALVDKIQKCFHYEEIRKMVTSAVYPHLEYFPIVVYILCVVACLGFSAVFHTFKCVSHPVHKILHRLDMAGISFLNFGSSYGFFYYAFYCRPFIKNLYSLLLLVACAIVFVVSLGDTIHKHHNAKYKGLMFAFLGLSNLIPFTHLCIMAYKASDQNDNMPANFGFGGMLLMAVFYLVGLVFYVTKFPERYYPKKFDIWCNSHTIWHFFVLAAAVTQFFSVVHIYEARKHLHCMTC